MDYQRHNLTPRPAVLRIKKYDSYIQDTAGVSARTMRTVASGTDLFGRLRHPTPGGTPKTGYHEFSTTAQPRMNITTSQRSVSAPSQTVHLSKKPTTLAYQAALFAVHQAKASRQDVLSEQFSGTFADADKKSRKLTRSQKLFYGAGSLVFLFALTVSMQSVLTNKQAKEQLGVLGAQTQKPDEYGVPEGTGDKPAEAEVPKAALSAYNVNPELPRYIRIPSLNVFARIKHTGITKEGAIDAPANINDVSWYNQGARPGSETGTSLLLGHVSGWTAPGVFKKINQMKPGGQFEIEKGSGEKITYEVIRGESVPLDSLNMAKILTPEVVGEHDLKLMTCSGRYNSAEDHYEERYIVYAKIVR